MKHIFGLILLFFSIQFAVAQTHSITGTVALEDGRGIPTASVQLANLSTGDTFQTTTDANGNYAFISLAAGDSYGLSVEKEGDPLNGLSTFDVVLSSRHILGRTLLNSPYQIIAADVNQSNSVSTSDLISIRAVILARQTSFSNGLVWRFIPADFTFPSPQQPFAQAIPSEFIIDELNDDTVVDFVGVKIGDLNGSLELD